MLGVKLLNRFNLDRNTSDQQCYLESSYNDLHWYLLYPYCCHCTHFACMSDIWNLTFHHTVCQTLSATWCIVMLDTIQFLLDSPGFMLSFIVPVWWVCFHSSLRLLFLLSVEETGAVFCCCTPLQIMIWCTVHTEMHFSSSWLCRRVVIWITSAFLSA